MRNLITISIFFLSYFNGYSQTDSSKTEIIIIGTIHSGNKRFNHKTLYKLIELLNPDIILDEDSQKYKPVFGLKTARLLKIVKPSIEQLALQTFLKRNRNAVILPYDTTFASHQSDNRTIRGEYIARKNYIKNAGAVIELFHDKLFDVQKTKIDSAIYADFANKYNYYYSLFDTSTLSRINRKDMIDISRDIKNLEESVILSLGKKYLSDSLLVNNYAKEIQFWNLRNDHMVKQILYYSKQFEGKKIVVLTGVNHKYYLLDKINHSKYGKIKIVEFTDN